ncbi:MAG: YbaN family protein [Ottowia sp.]|uniref:YbaN family protein n=1 Tax=Ottowia sp. TaxID=1898956 RepID=UPI003C70DBFE
MSEPERAVPDEKRVLMRKRIAMLLWRALAIAAVGLAILGTVLPVLPTVPFLLVAAWAAGKGWPAFERWLLDHAHFGPPIRRWRENGAVPRRAKWASTLMMAGSAIGLQFFANIPLWTRIGVPAVMGCVAVWLWMRPEE